MKKLKILLFLFLIPIILVAQERKISGTVMDEKGEGIPGVNVLIKGTTIGTITNMEGVYQLNIANAKDAILVFSFIGFENQEVAIGNSLIVDITLKEESIGLNEVIAVGYGTQTKATLTGAVASIKSEELTQTKGQDVQNMLTGRVSGVRVVQNSSEPGALSNDFDIRGFSGNPLIIIDGVPRGDFSRIDPSEVESISVLKDASAAVYGIQAANGVVLVTTKKGKIGAPKLSYSMFYGVQNPTEYLKPVGAVDRMVLFNDRTLRNLNDSQLTYGEEDFEAYRNGTLHSTDWYDAVIREYAPQQQHNINLSGGSENVNYFVNLGYANQEGFWKSGDLDYNRYNLRTNIEAKVTKRLTFGIKVNGILDQTNSPNATPFHIFKNLWRSVPDESVYANDNPDYFQKPGADINNPVAMTQSDTYGFKKNKNKIFQSTFNLEYDIPGVKGLKAKGLFSYDTRIADNTQYTRSYGEYNYDEVTDIYAETIKNAPTKLNRYYGNGETIMYNVSLDYKRSFAEMHNVSALALFEARKSTGDNFFAERQFSIDFPYLYAGNSYLQEGSARADGITELARNAFVGKLNYDFKGKYLAEFSFRYDGSSANAPDNQYGFFPGGSIGWRMSEEGFIKNNFSWIENLKLRASYGILGDDGPAMQYLHLSGYDYPNTDGGIRDAYPTGYMFDGLFTNALGFRASPNPDVTWYESKTTDIGIDADFLNGLFGFTADYFIRQRDGLLDSPQVTVPGTYGSSIAKQNINKDKTEGLDLEIRHRHNIGDFRYSINGNFSITRTSWVYKIQSPFGNSYDNWRNNDSDRYRYIFWGYSGDGQYQNWNEIRNDNVLTSTDVLPGDYRYKDWNGDGVINDKDMHPIAQEDKPLINFGINLSADYKGFDFNMLLQGAALSYVEMSEALSQPLMWDGNALDFFMDRWHPKEAGVDPYDPTISWVSGEYAYARTSESKSEFSMQNGKYMRIKNIELGYTIPKSILQAVKIEQVRVFVNAYNLYTFTGVKAVDPEKPSDDTAYTYPLNRTFNLGAKITF